MRKRNACKGVNAPHPDPTPPPTQTAHRHHQVPRSDIDLGGDTIAGVELQPGTALTFTRIHQITDIGDPKRRQRTRRQSNTR